MSNKVTSRHIKTGARVILNFFKNHKKEVSILFAVNLITAIGNGIVPYISGKLFDSIIHPTKTFTLFELTLPQIIWILVTLAIIQIILAVVEYHNSMRNSLVAFYSRFDYITNAYSKLLDLPLRFHKTHKMGDIKSKIHMSGWGMQTLVERLLSNIGADLLTVLVSIVVIFFIQPEVAIFSVIGLVIFLGLSVNSIKSAGNIENKFTDVWGKAFANAEDAVTNITAVKQATAEDYEKRKLKRGFISIMLPYWLGEDRIWSTLRFHQRVVIIVVQIIVFIWSIRLVTLGVMTIGELIAFNAYLTMLFGPFVNLLNMSKTIQSGLININAVEKVIAVPAEAYEPLNMIHVPTIQGNIDFQNVAFGYQNKQLVLQDINFKVTAGQVIALVGESGVGKSTLIDLLSAYNFPTKGKVLIDSVDIKRIPLKQLRQSIAIVPQEVVLFNDTILTNIKYGNFKATDKEVKEAARKAHALSFIEKFPKKWKQVVGERGVKLSVGQKQRVAIARAILRDPKILILDEPTSALDAKSEKVIQDSLNDLMKGRTTFVVAHRLSTVRKADLILVFEGGRIVESGNHEDLIQKENGIYRHLHELQIGLHN